MNIKELRMAAKKLQIDPGFYCLSGKAADRNTDYYGHCQEQGKMGDLLLRLARPGRKGRL